MSLSLPPTANGLQDVDQTTQGTGKVLSKTASGGKPFSWQSSAASSAGSLTDVDQTTQASARVLTETASGGKPFSWQTPITTAGALTDVDQTTQGSGKILANTTSGGKPFSFVTPTVATVGSLPDIDQTTQGAAKVLTNTTSGGKPFSWQTPSGGGSGLFSGLITIPTLSQFTQVIGASSVTFSDSASGIYATSPNNLSSQKLGMITQTPPSPPYTITALLGNGSIVGVCAGGIAFYDGTKIELIYLSYDTPGNGLGLVVQQNSNSTTFNANVFIVNPGIVPSNLAWLQIANDGTNLHYRFSVDGSNFYEIYSEAVGSFITPTKVAFALNAYNVSRLNFTLMSWLQT